MCTQRVTLDLSSIFNDYRHKAFVLIKSDWKNIEALQSHIINLFGLEHFVYLTNEDGILYPAGEKIDLISKNETLIVHKITVKELMTPNPIPIQTKKIKMSKEPRKSKKNHVDKKITELKELKESNASLSLKKDSKMAKTSKTTIKSSSSSQSSSTSSSDEEMMIPTLLTKLDEAKSLFGLQAVKTEINQKRKRKRIRKRSNQKISPTATSCMPSTSNSNLVKISQSMQANHLRFESNASDSSSDTESLKFKTIKKICPHNHDEPLRGKKHFSTIYHWSSQMQCYVDENELSVTNQLPINETSFGLFISPPENENLMPVDDQLTEAEVPTQVINICGATPNTAKSDMIDRSSLEELRKDICDLSLPLIETIPKIGTVIAFKLVRMDDQSQPTISDYIIGSVKKVNEQNMELNLNLLAGKDEAGSRIQKTLIDEHGQMVTTEDSDMEIKFSELIDPRECLCFPK